MVMRKGPNPKSQTPNEREKGDVSAEAMSLARAVDRVCKRPGRYVVVIEVGEKGRGGWQVEVGRLELLYQLSRERNGLSVTGDSIE
jgi:hypothetical protein